ncbi:MULTISPECIES: RHS repeat-associated core domain-containing protein [Pseudomonas]|uniref:RHS repeat-associated core domain-containing protein n=1 Tax=Pseudomonas TaxID=286 RepID=UPI002852F344|nr:RHS repeat-associated core domain-containing protein [Pseudomonas sp. B21-031]
MTDEQGHTLWRSDYRGWGNTRDEWHSPRQEREQNLRYQGQYLDREIGLHYNTFRFYDPEVGCFTTCDPIGLNGIISLYTYASNPTVWIDPLGLAPKASVTIGGSASRMTPSTGWCDPIRGCRTHCVRL